MSVEWRRAPASSKWIGKTHQSFDWTRGWSCAYPGRDRTSDYEEFEDRDPVGHYDKPSIQTYLRHCRAKAAEAVAAETEQSLVGHCGFPRRTLTRAELHVYNIRHLQHHAAQLSLRLRLDAGINIPWFGTGWREK